MGLTPLAEEKFRYNESEHRGQSNVVLWVNGLNGFIVLSVQSAA
jgi:hypothetical protein